MENKEVEKVLGRFCYLCSEIDCCFTNVVSVLVFLMQDWAIILF